MNDEFGNPLDSATYIYIYGTDIWTITQPNGSYLLKGISTTAPCYIVSVHKDRYLISRAGNVDAENETTINFTLYIFDPLNFSNSHAEERYLCGIRKIKCNSSQSSPCYYIQGSHSAEFSLQIFP